MAPEKRHPDHDWDDSMVTDPDSVHPAKAGNHREPPRREPEPDAPFPADADAEPSADPPHAH